MQTSNKSDLPSRWCDPLLLFMINEASITDAMSSRQTQLFTLSTTGVDVPGGYD